ncbi:unnamed protein product, partial [Pylaiella littoralis]
EGCQEEGEDYAGDASSCGRGGSAASAGETEADFEEAEGALPGVPPGGGLLASFVGQEARFALKCATDKGAWQFNQQRRHALAHLAFVSYATDRILRGHHNHHRNQSQACARRHEDGNTSSGAKFGGNTKISPCPEAAAKDVLGGGEDFIESTVGGTRCLTYCEVTGARKLIFPLALTAVGSSSSSSSSAGYGDEPGAGLAAGVGGHEHRHSLAGAEAGDGGGRATSASDIGVEKAALQAFRALNAFVGGLAAADAVEAVGDKKSTRCGVAPYAINV